MRRHLIVPIVLFVFSLALFGGVASAQDGDFFIEEPTEMTAKDYGKCNFDSDCHKGVKCHSSRCADASGSKCNFNSDCGGKGAKCNSGKCSNAPDGKCNFNSECPGGKCSSGKCKF